MREARYEIRDAVHAGASFAHHPRRKHEDTKAQRPPAYPLQARRLHHKGGPGLLWQHASRVQVRWAQNDSFDFHFEHEHKHEREPRTGPAQSGFFLAHPVSGCHEAVTARILGAVKGFVGGPENGLGTFTTLVGTSDPDAH
jgi:hypothetical protein